MIEIVSRENRIFKECLRLTQRKYREREGLYLIEGRSFVKEAMISKQPIKYLIMSQGFNEEELDGTETGETVYRFSDALFNNIAQTETSQGIVAVIEKPDTSVENMERSCNPSDNWIVLDRLQDPGNVGTILRTAVGSGYGGVLVMKGTVDVFSPKVVRAAAGSLFRIPIAQVSSKEMLLECVRRGGRSLVVTAFDGAVCCYDAQLSERIALVIGNEGQGVADELIESADIKVRIPMSGDLESLNASVAAAILMYEAVRVKYKR